jgi:two-component system phosphate regulon response regulator PhoB
MAREHILVVDDEEDLLELIGYNLTKEGYRVTYASSGEEAIKKARAELPGLIVLDLLLPSIDGLEVCRSLKSYPKTSHIPIVMLTAKAEEIDEVAGLEVGADDYVTKPFSPRVLLARIKAVLRRKSKEQPDAAQTIKIQDLVIDPERHEVLLANQPLTLTLTEFRLLHVLAQRRGRAFTRVQIVDAVMGEDYPVTERSVDVHVASLRKKLGAMGGSIETVRGVGYRFKE